MKPAKPCCARRRGKATSAAPLSAVGVASTMAALLVPKCPLCIAAYLTLCGLGGAWAAAVAPVVRPAAFAASFVAFAALVVMWGRRWRSATGSAAGDHVAGLSRPSAPAALAEGAPGAASRRRAANERPAKPPFTEEAR